MKWIHRNQKPRIRRGQKSSDTFIARHADQGLLTYVQYVFDGGKWDWFNSASALVVDGEPINLLT